MPGKISTRTSRSASMWPAPLHAVHAFFGTSPVPWHFAHVLHLRKTAEERPALFADLALAVARRTFLKTAARVPRPCRCISRTHERPQSQGLYRNTTERLFEGNLLLYLQVGSFLVGLAAGTDADSLKDRFKNIVRSRPCRPRSPSGIKTAAFRTRRSPATEAAPLRAAEPPDRARRRRSRPSGPPLPKRSYCARLFLSESTWYASLISLNFFSSPPDLSGWY